MFSKPKRNHFTIIFERLGFLFFILIIMSGQQVFAMNADYFSIDFWKGLFLSISDLNTSNTQIFGLIVLVILIIIAIILFQVWRKTYFYIDGNDFVYERKTLFKKNTRLPVKNIATVNLHSGILERIIGTTKVKMDLNSAKTAEKTDFKLVMKLSDAKLFQDEILKLKNRLNTPDGEKSEKSYENYIESLNKKPEKVISFSMGSVIRHKILSLPLLQSIILFAIAYAEPIISSRDFSQLRNLLSLSMFYIIGGVLNAVWGILNLGNYTVLQDEKNYYINCGVLQKRAYSFEKNKINGVIVKQPFLALIMKVSSIEIAVIGLGNEKKETPHLSLMSDKTKNEELINKYVKEFKCGFEKIKADYRAMVLYAFYILAISAIFIITAASLLPKTPAFFILITLIPIIFTIVSILIIKIRYIKYDENVFCYSEGLFTRKTGSFRYGDIQNIRVETNFILRKFNLGKVKFSILSGNKLKNHTISYFDLNELEAVVNKTVEHRDNVARIMRTALIS